MVQLLSRLHDAHDGGINLGLAVFINLQGHEAHIVCHAQQEVVSDGLELINRCSCRAEAHSGHFQGLQTACLKVFKVYTHTHLRVKVTSQGFSL